MASSDRTLPLPRAAEKFIPHRAPMRLIDTLVEYGDQSGVIETRVAPDCPFLDDSEVLGPVALAEMMAQAYAVIKGYADTLVGKPVKEGFLVGIKKIDFTDCVSAGDLLRIEVRTTAALEGFIVAEGDVCRDGLAVASGTFKVWIP